MKFNHYKLEDFLSDRDFIEWVNGGDSLEKHIYFEQWIKSNPKNLDELYLAREIILSLKCESLASDEEDYNEVLSRIVSHKFKDTSNESFSGTTSNKTIRQISPVWIRAAVLLLLFAFSIVLFRLTEYNKAGETISQNKIVKENPWGQRSKIQLPDGSIVWLNAGSQISYAEKFVGATRQVTLKGEAFFEVKSDPEHPFVVKSGSFATKALGTSFNINAYNPGKQIEVALVHGKVEVADTATEMKVTLLPGERAVGNESAHELKKSLFRYEDKIAWKDGILVFQDADLEEVATVLMRWYNVDLHVAEYPNEHWVYNGSFDNMSLEQVLKRMSYTESFAYEIDNKIVTLKFKNEL